MTSQKLKNILPETSDDSPQKLLSGSPDSSERGQRNVRRISGAQHSATSSITSTPKTGPIQTTPTRATQNKPSKGRQNLPPPDNSKLENRASGPANMSSQRRGIARSGQRGGSSEDHFNINELWDDARGTVASIFQNEKQAKALKEKILALEARMKQKKDSGLADSIPDLTELEALYREDVKLSEQQKSMAADAALITKIQLLADMQRQNEQNEESQPSARNSSSRTSGIDFDGPSDSPIPSPADNRVRKLGGSRTSSQPPRSNIEIRLDGTPSEAGERAGKPKIVYTMGEEVAFKRKLPGGKPEEQDWIQGEVVRVIGDGKSRRYDVKDIDPDAANSPTNIYKSSASQMVPIPAKGTTFGEYEVGKQVLALYPQATTFYRAEVKSTIEDGAMVLLIFEEETVEKPVARRFVLDHKG